jgi:hypothetical protein
MFISKLTNFFAFWKLAVVFPVVMGELPIGCLLFAFFWASARGRDFNCLHFLYQALRHEGLIEAACDGQDEETKNNELGGCLF